MRRSGHQARRHKMAERPGSPRGFGPRRSRNSDRRARARACSRSRGGCAARSWSASGEVTPRSRVTRSMTFAQPGEDLADLEPGKGRVDRLEVAADIGGSVGLGVERVDVRRPAREPDEDAVLDLRRPPLTGTRPRRRGGGRGHPGRDRSLPGRAEPARSSSRRLGPGHDVREWVVAGMVRASPETSGS